MKNFTCYLYFFICFSYYTLNAQPKEQYKEFSKKNIRIGNKNQPFSNTKAEQEFGNITGWNNTRANQENGFLAITLLPNTLAAYGGMITNVAIPKADAYEVSFDVQFDNNFDWSRGGKLGFGFKIGEGNTGCDKADDGNGGSIRLMWYTNNAGRTYLKPYLYYKDMPGTCGNDFEKYYPTEGSIEKGKLYSVRIYIKANTDSSTNGYAKVVINKTVVLDTAIRWTTNPLQQYINTLTFHTFRGGSTMNWASANTNSIYYKNIRWRKIKSSTNNF